MKRTIQNPEYFEGKIIDTTKWIMPPGWNVCAKTGKFMNEDNLCNTFSHYLYEKTFLIDNGIYIENANWLSDEGYEEIIITLETIGAPTPLELCGHDHTDNITTFCSTRKSCIRRQ